MYYIILFLDNQSPILICPVNQTLETDLRQPTAAAVWDNPLVTDNAKISPSVTCNANSGSLFEIGQTNVLCEAWDSNGNYATCTFTIDVKSKFGIVSIFV